MHVNDRWLDSSLWRVGRSGAAAPRRYYCLSIFVARTRLGTTLPTRTVLAAAVTEEAGREGKKMNTK